MEAQTTRLALFGPVIVVVAFCKHLRVFKYVISTYTYELIQKKHVEKNNYSPRAQTTRDASSGHLSRVRLCPYPRSRRPRRSRCRRCRRCRAVVVLVVVLLLHRRCRACCRCRG